MKICTKCKQTKEFSEFGKSKQIKDGHKSACKECLRSDNRLYYSNNTEKESIRKKKQYECNGDKINAKTLEYYHNNKRKRRVYLNKKRKEQPEVFKEYDKTFNKTHPDYDKNYTFNRRQKDPVFKLIGNLRTRVYNSLQFKKSNKNNTLKKYIGCSPQELKNHLENQFKKGMTWINYGKWHVDHIIPLATVKTEEEIYSLFHYTNLQPLWAIDNLKKSDKIK